jgi:hypothetical protein
VTAPAVVRRIRLTRIDIVPACTEGTGTGLDAEGREVTFPVDWRPALALAEALEAGETLEVTLVNRQVACWRGER